MGRTPHSPHSPHWLSDHPHAGGENLRHRPITDAGCGPSPRGWGELPSPRFRRVRDRTIPTRVGRTTRTGNCPWSKPDHPHAGGENLHPLAAHPQERGPSPRGWGERYGRLDSDGSKRTIPTRVGRTLVIRRDCQIIPDHPHAGGENTNGESNIVREFGPSPRGWGEPRPTVFLPPGGRTIPTRVGRTKEETSTSVEISDHPHAGGENSGMPTAYGVVGEVIRGIRRGSFLDPPISQPPAKGR